MKVLAISGSPRPQGNTHLLLSAALKVLEEQGIATEYLSLHGKDIRPCLACLKCAKDKNRCAQEDDFMPIYEAMAGADGLIVGSPVYFGSATPNLMALLDRAGYVARQGDNVFAARWAPPSWWPGGPGSISPTPNCNSGSASWGCMCRAPATGPSPTASSPATPPTTPRDSRPLPTWRRIWPGC